MGKRLSEDEIKYVISAETAKAQKEIFELSKATKELRREERERRKAMIELEAQGKKNTEEYRRLSQECKEYSKSISENEKRMDGLRKRLDINVMSMAQLRKHSKDLRHELDNISKTMEPERYAAVEKQLSKVSERMNELKVSAKSLVEIATSETALSTMAGMLSTKLAEFAGDALARMKEIAAEGIQMAEAADGVKRAFDRMDDGTILDNLRKATKGTVTDLDLMKAAVKAKDFRIPLEDLGKYLQFAQLKAQQTGQSVDYMTESIVTGLGRKSPLILDNLGLSAAEINEQVSKTGDFMSAVATIVDKQLAAAGENYVSAADRAQAASVRFKNAQLELGQTLLPLKENWDELYTGISVGTMELIGWIVKHRNVLVTLVTAYTAYKITKELVTTATYKEMTATKASILLDKIKLAWINNTKGATLLFAAAKAKLTGNTLRANAAMRLFNATCKASTIGWIAGAVALAGAAFMLMRNRANDTNETLSSLNNIQKKTSERFGEQAAKVKALSDILHNGNVTYQERKKALDDLQDIIPGYTASLTTEGKLVNENTNAINAYLAALEKEIKLKAAKEELEELYKKQRNTQKEKKEYEQNLQTAKDIPLNASGQTGAMAAMGKSAEISAYQAKIEETSKKLLDINQAIQDINQEIAKSSVKRIDERPVKTDMIEAKKKEIEEAEKVIATTREEVVARNRKVAALKAELEALQNLGIQEKGKGSIAEKEKKKVLESEKEAIAELATLRDRALADEERKNTAAMNAHRLLLGRKQITEQQYAIWEAAFNSNLADRRLSIEEEYAAKAGELEVTDGKLKEQAVRDAAKRVEKAEQQSFEARLKAEQTYRNNIDALRQMAEQTPATPEAKLQAEYATKLQLLEAYYQSSLDYAKQNGKNEAEVTELYNQAKLNLDKRYQEEKKKLAEKSIEELKALQGNDISQQFTDIFNNIEKLQEAIANADFSGMLQSIQGIINSVLSGLNNAFNTFKQIEIDNVEAKYDAEIEAAQGNAEEVERLEQEKAQKKLDIEKKYADVQFAVKASQIIANTALAIMMAYGQLGPIAGPIAAALMAATGAIQLAAANAERQKVKNMTLSGSGSGNDTTGARVATGRQDGGKIDVRRTQDGKLFPDAEYDPDARGFIDHPTVIVGEGPSGQSKEWVASNAAVSNPTVAPILDILDKSQQAGTIRTLDLNQAIRARMAGYSSGGSIDVQAKTEQHPTDNSGGILPPELMKRFVNAIIHLDDNGVGASIVLSEFERKQALRNRSRKIGSK